MKPPVDPPDLTAVPEPLRLLSLLWSLDAALDRASGQMDATLGVTGPQRFLLRFVGLAPGITSGQLAKVLALDAADLQLELQHLVTENLLTIQADSPGYYLTGKGAGVNSVLKGTVEQAVSKAIDEASAYERASFRRMLERILRHLGSPV